MPSYLYLLISTHNWKKVASIKSNHRFFKNNFFCSTFTEWNNLDSNIHSFPTYELFRKGIFECIRPHRNNTFNVANSLLLTYITKLRIGLSHFREREFRHNFRDSLKPVCDCGNAAESTKHYLLLQNVRTVNSNLLHMNKDMLTHLLPCF